MVEILSTSSSSSSSSSTILLDVDAPHLNDYNYYKTHFHYVSLFRNSVCECVSKYVWRRIVKVSEDEEGETRGR